ncbi:DUF3750 domain-containing protein [Patescibacteria group bacterium]|nr:DUF3750 domain-containing protein [Patescibacteria group bacterium]
MNYSNLEYLIKKDKYQVFLFICPIGLPLSFAVHPWFVINNKGVISRWEVTLPRYNRKLSFGHLNKDLYPYFQGIEMFPYTKKYKWKYIKLLGSIEGNEESVAQKMVNCIQNSEKKYPFSQNYSLLGLNSNTYVQWVLNQFPESNMSLPWNAFGKNKI